MTIVEPSRLNVIQMMGLAPTRTDGPFARSVARSTKVTEPPAAIREGVAVGREVGSRGPGLGVGEVRQVADLRGVPVRGDGTRGRVPSRRPSGRRPA